MFLKKTCPYFSKLCNNIICSPGSNNENFCERGLSMSHSEKVKNFPRIATKKRNEEVEVLLKS